MTSMYISEQHLPSTMNFLNSVCPGLTYCDDNVHYSLKGELAKNEVIDWAITGSPTSRKGRLEEEYLNIARPPLNSGSNESTTYVSLPFHVTNLFRKIIKTKDKSTEGSMHIGANLNPLSRDPFKVVLLNPGCLSAMVEIDNLRNRNTLVAKNSNKNPFNKLTTNFNKLLKITTMSSTSQESNNFSNLLDFLENKSSNSSINPHSTLIDKILEYNPDTYLSELQSPSTSKLLICSNINILNVIAIDPNSNYKGKKQITTDKPVFPYVEESAGKEYNKLIESNLLRIQFRQNSIITTLRSFVSISNEPIVLVGLESGEVVIINLTHLKYQIFDDLGLNLSNSDTSSITSGSYSNSFGNVPVTSLDVLKNTKYDFLIIAGYANGEIIILNPYAPANDEKVKNRYIKRVVGKDNYITYFRKFDLSPFNGEINSDSNDCPDYLVGHFKLSHKSITSITSTLPYNIPSSSNHPNPMILAIASDDGLVRLIDLISTYDMNYGDPDNPLNNLIVSDTISNYFNDGITDIEFSSDFKFLCVVGRGDLIEIFKMTYYNVNGLLTKNISSTHQSTTNVSGMNRRSRSGTLNSLNSINYNNFLSPMNITPSNSFEITSEVQHQRELYPSIVKDIKVAGRFKGHTNTVNKIRFVKCEPFCTSDLELSINNSVYKLISCGFDGKIMIWEFDYKALPKVKIVPTSKTRKRQSIQSKRPLISHTASPIPINNRLSVGPVSSIPIKSSFHNRNRSLNNEEIIPSPNISSLNSSNFNNFGSPLNIGGMNMTTILKQASANNINNNTENSEVEQIKIIKSLYRSLYDLRLKRHYGNNNKKFTTIIHPIVNDRLVPSIEVPLLTLDLSYLIKDGKIDGFYLDPSSFWCFGKNGDIFKYAIK